MLSNSLLYMVLSNKMGDGRMAHPPEMVDNNLVSWENDKYNVISELS